ncbi:tRNA pseudouridine32 synthase / 23S rRNA pseudouridine746 synthase [Andreprevotia lacus DSM 23236]|uniref:tRNA pseudouridine32 synthase / 23S rRNA pseudouridine746 synthase n=1 Tax=Andreprevotia lacus DSM 23236 TaxID=1121001 RepID=A0A1W1XBR6_9NEIS|nr:pseudouridine synthase [Andreprevotia lacus]SMC21309.1 tRNA pseudouridine32 synthase / 23S rRNA pseudouridine746 synthase [Andreprevotia lacus DSM 23236]
MPKPSHCPLPQRDGITPSYLELPAGSWPSLLAFLVARFPHVAEAAWLERLQRGALVDPDGVPFAPDSPYRAYSRIWYYREVPRETPVPFEEYVLYRDNQLVVADKPHFLACIPAGRHLQETLLTRLRIKLDLPDLAPIHRLDRETAGIMLFCADPAYRGAYQKLFAERRVEKEYEAIAPYRADLALPLVHRSRLEERPENFTMYEADGEPNSETRISLIAQRGDWAHYRLQPHTGKKHQLRAHLCALGIPILHDPWYPLALPDKGDDFSRPLQLLARSITFTDPVSGKEHTFRSERVLRWADGSSAPYSG